MMEASIRTWLTCRTISCVARLTVSNCDCFSNGGSNETNNRKQCRQRMQYEQDSRPSISLLLSVTRQLDKTLVTEILMIDKCVFAIAVFTGVYERFPESHFPGKTFPGTSMSQNVTPTTPRWTTLSTQLLSIAGPARVRRVVSSTSQATSTTAASVHRR